MYRQTNYPWQEPYETDFLFAQRFPYEGLGLLAMDLLGTSTLASGLACAPTGPASMSVQMAPGRLYSVQNLEPVAWGQLLGIGGLAADTNADHNILKQGLYRDTTVLPAMTAPGTVGQSQNYLIQAAFSEVDAVPTSIPFVSSTPPFAPIAPSTLNTVRQDLCVISVKAGTPAATGSQTTPAPDAGNVGLYVVTIAQGQTSITSGNISAYPGTLFITETLTQKISQATGDARYLKLVNARTQLTANTTFYVATTGNDSTGNGTVGNPWLTVQHAINAIQTAYDLTGFVVTIQLADGTYAASGTEAMPLVGATSQTPLIINGNAVTPSNVVIGNSISSRFGASLQVQNLKIASSSDGFVASDGGQMTLGAGIEFGACTGAHIYAATGGRITLSSNYKISGGAAAHYQAINGGILNFGAPTVTITGTPAFSIAFANILLQSLLGFSAAPTFSGSATGTKYLGNFNSVINTTSANVSLFPGSVSGTTSTGAQYN